MRKAMTPEDRLRAIAQVNEVIIEHAAVRGRPDPSGQRCGCTCAEAATS